MKKIVFVLLGWLLLLGCDVNQLDFENVENPRWEGLIALPIGEFNYTLQELFDELEDSTLVLEEDEETLLYSLVYTDNVSYTASDADFISITDVTNSFSVPLPQTGPVTADSSFTLPVSQLLLPFPADGDGLDSLIYGSGVLSIDVTTTNNSVSHVISFPTTRNPGGDTISFTGNTYPSNVAGYDLTNHSITFQEDNGENSYPVTLAVTVNLAAGETILPNDSVTVSTSFANQTFSRYFGYFGQDTVDFAPLSFPVDFFESLGGTDAVAFRGPQITLNMTSNVGIPIGLVFDDVYGLSGNDSTFMTGPITTVSGALVIDAPTVDQIGESISSRDSIVQGNSNINEIFGNTPNELVFNLKGVSNPQGNQGTNFYVPGAGQIDADIEIRLPLEMKLTGLTRDISFDTEGIEIDDVDSITMRIVTENLLPFSTLMDVYFYGEADTVIYQLDQSLVMATPFINLDFVANEAEPNVADIPLPREGIEALANARRIECVVTLNTPETLNSRDIFPKWLSRYDLTVKLSLLAKLDRKL